jgi:hypothetical protein
MRGVKWHGHGKFDFSGGETRSLKELFVHRTNAGGPCPGAAGDWIYEVKFDGYRALAFKAGSEVQLFSRNRKLFNDNYPILVAALKSLKADLIIDGEIAAPGRKWQIFFATPSILSSPGDTTVRTKGGPCLLVPIILFFILKDILSG